MLRGTDLVFFSAVKVVVGAFILSSYGLGGLAPPFAHREVQVACPTAHAVYKLFNNI
jgi:hypothetical protein